MLNSRALVITVKFEIASRRTAKNNDKGVDVEILVRKALAKDLRSNGQISQQMSSTFGLKRSA